MRVRRRRARWSGLLGMLLVGSAAVLALAPVAGADQPTGQVRLGHLSPSTSAVDVTVEGPEGASSTSQVVARGAAYGAVTDYLKLVPGRYSVEMRPAGADPTTPAVLSAGLQIAPQSAQSLFFFDSGPSGQVRGELIDDDLTAPPTDSGRVRIVQAAEGIAPVQALAVDGPRLATDLGYGTVTDYSTVAAKTWDVRLSSGATTEAAQLPVGGGSVNTVVVTRSGGAITLTPLVDVAGLPVAITPAPAAPAPAGAPGAAPAPAPAPAPQASVAPAPPAASSRPVPQGGVPAGGGGLSDDGPGVLPLVLALAGAPLLVYAASVGSTLRRR